MLESKYLHRLVLIFISLVFLTTCIMLFWTRQHYYMYEQELIEQNAELTGAILSRHPELEEDIIDSILSDENNTEAGMEILEKYGLGDTEAYYRIRDLRALEEKMETDTIWMVLISFGIVAFVFFFYVVREHKKVKELNRYMNRILNGDYSLDIRDYEEGEMSHLKNEIYKMTILLKEKSDGAMKDKLALEETLSDISHQIKTPLTSMYVMNDLLADPNMDADTRQEFLNKNRKQLERIEWLVSSLLKLSRMESGMVQMKHDRINVKKLVTKAIDPLRIPIELKNQKLVVNIKKNLSMVGDEAWLIEALVNILKNAHEHTDEEGTIVISASDNPIYKEISIADNGCGIDKEDLPHLFERFYKAKTSKSDSVGIGLHLAEKIVKSMNGEILVESEVLKGTTFRLRFYK